MGKKKQYSTDSLCPGTLLRRRALEFLRESLPESDLANYPPELFEAFANHALMLRETAPWCRELPWEIFCHYVLFPRVNDEDLSFHRELFFRELWERVRGMENTEERVLEVNRWCHEQATYEPQDDRTASPLTVYRCGSGRCGEESAFLVSALRSVGIAARQVYVPRWSHCDDNHAWVEALCDGRWRYLGACEPEPVLDRGWFSGAAAEAMLVHSRVFGTEASFASERSASLHGELLYREGKVSWNNQTARYAPVRRYTFRALRGGRPIPGALFLLQILNEASFHTIATLTAGKDGTASAHLGIGSLHVLALCGDLRAEGDCADGTVALCLEPETVSEANKTAGQDASSRWEPFRFYPPGINSVKQPAGTAPGPAASSVQSFPAPTGAENPAVPGIPAPLTPAQKQARTEVLKRGDALRVKRHAAWWNDAWTGTPHEALLRAARGNAGEIAAFLGRDKDPRREELLRPLTDKDLRDVTAELLESHLARLPGQRDLPDEIYWPYVASPRIATEPLTAWREVLCCLGAPDRHPDPLREQIRSQLSEQIRDQFWGCLASDTGDLPRRLWSMLHQVFQNSENQNYVNLYWTPAAALRSGRCDEKSLRLLYVALLRDCGIPARLRPEDGLPEFWQKDRFRPADPGEEQTAFLHLDCGDTRPPRFRSDWTLSRRIKDGWRLWNLPDGIWTGSTLTLALPAGGYRLLSTVRLPDGSQRAAKLDLTLYTGETLSVDWYRPSYDWKELLYRKEMPVTPALTLAQKSVADLFCAREKPALLLWLEENREPTEHLLRELLERKEDWAQLPVEFLCILPNKQAQKDPSIAALGKAFPDVHFLLMEDPGDLEAVFRRVNCEPNQYPLAVLTDGDGNARFAACGYRVGMGELLRRAVEIG